MEINAQDENGKIWIKEIEILTKEDGTQILSLGFPYQWELKMLQDYPPQDNIMYIDAAGRNHAGTTVSCPYSELMKKADDLILLNNCRKMF